MDEKAYRSRCRHLCYAVALRVGRMTADLDVDGTPRTIDNLALAVWTRASGHWQLLAYAPTPLPG